MLLEMYRGSLIIFYLAYFSYQLCWLFGSFVDFLLFTRALRQLPPRQLPPDNSLLKQLTQGRLLPRQFPPRIIASWAIPLNNSDLRLLYCLRIITPGQLLPRATTITNYNFFMAISCFFSNFYFLIWQQKW